MHKHKIYTGIGSRETPFNTLNLMVRIGATLAGDGWTLRSGHAPGADQAFEDGAKLRNGKMEIYLPWRSFEGADSSPEFVLTQDYHPEATEIAMKFHPAWHRCSQGAKKLHQRNVYQIVGKELDTPTDLVICWTKDGARKGGTGQALRMAEHLQIPIFDLAVCNEEAILDFVNHGVVP
jgi:hypothetical protein